MDANTMIEQMIKLTDEDILRLKEYCEKEINLRHEKKSGGN